MVVVDILSFLVAIAAIALGYKLFVERKKGKQMSEIRGIAYSFYSCLALLWIINILIGFVK